MTILSNKITYPDVDYGSPEENCDHTTIIASYRKENTNPPYNVHNTYPVIFERYTNDTYSTEHPTILDPRDFIDGMCSTCGNLTDQTLEFIHYKEDLYWFCDPVDKFHEIMSKELMNRNLR